MTLRAEARSVHSRPALWPCPTMEWPPIKESRPDLETAESQTPTAMFGRQLLALGQQLQTYRSGRQCQTHAHHQRGLPGQACQQCQATQGCSTQQHLQPAHHKIGRRISFSRASDSSSPITNSNITTPLRWPPTPLWVTHQCQFMWAQQHAGGQIYAKIAPKPNRLNNGTASTAASKNTNASSRPPLSIHIQYRCVAQSLRLPDGAGAPGLSEATDWER